MAFNLTGESGSFTYSGADAGVMASAVFGAWRLKSNRREYETTPPAYLMESITLGILRGRVSVQGFQDDQAAPPPVPMATSGTLGTLTLYSKATSKYYTFKARLVDMEFASNSYDGAPQTVHCQFRMCAGSATDTIVITNG